MSVERSTCAGREKGHNPQRGPLLEVTRCISHRIVRRARSTARRAGSSVYLYGMSLVRVPISQPRPHGQVGSLRRYPRSTEVYGECA